MQPEKRAPHRVVHVVNRLGDGGDGISNVCVDLACQQASDGHRVAIATTLGGYSELVSQFGVEVAEVNFRVRDPFGLARATQRLRRLLHAVRPDIVHAHTLVATLIARVATVGTGAKVMATVHNEYQRGVALMAVAHRVVGVSVAVSDAMRRRGVPARKTRTVLNGVVGSVRRQRSDPVVPGGLAAPAVVTVGSVSHRKGADLLVEAAIRLAETHGAHTYFVGQVDWEEPQRTAQRSAAADHIHFLGFQRDPRRFLAAATVFVLASRRDPAPLVLVEAMEAGLPIVAAAVDGVPELLADSDGAGGLLVPPGRPDALVSAIQGLLDDEVHRARLSAAARRRSTHLSVARVCEDYRALYAELALPAGSEHR